MPPKKGNTAEKVQKTKKKRRTYEQHKSRKGSKNAMKCFKENP